MTRAIQKDPTGKSKTAGDCGIVQLAVADFFLSATSWRDQTDIKNICDIVLPQSILDRIKAIVGKQRDAVSDLCQLRWGDEEYLIGGDLRAETATIARDDANGFDMVWLHHDCLALVRNLYSNAVPALPDLSSLNRLQTLDYLGRICCTISYDGSPSAQGYIKGKSPYTGVCFFLWRDPASPRSFSLFLPGHDPKNSHTAGLFTNYLMLIFAATAKVLYYTTKAAREIKALAHARMNGRQDQITAHYREVLLPQIVTNAASGAELAAVIANHLGMADDGFLAVKAAQCRQWMDDAGIGMSGFELEPPDEATILLMVKQSESETLEFKSSFIKPSDDDVFEKRQHISDQKRFDQAIRSLEDAIKMRVIEAVLQLMNGRGGYVLLGVDPKGNIVGLDFAYELSRQGKVDYNPRDSFDQFIGQELQNAVEKPYQGFVASKARRSYTPIGDKTVCCLTVEPVRSGVFDKNGVLHVRQGGCMGSKLIGGAAQEYIRQQAGGLR